MDKKTWASWFLLLMMAYPACADSFQDQVTRHFPGFVIMGYTDFDPDIRKNLDSNPGFITGYFDPDKFEDFAALLRGTVKKNSIVSERVYDYYDTRLVVCHGSGKKKYVCTILFSSVMVPPEYHYLVKYPPGSTLCWSSRGDPVEAKTEFIGWRSTKAWATGSGETQYVHQPDGSYLKCGADN